MSLHANRPMPRPTIASIATSTAAAHPTVFVSLGNPPTFLQLNQNPCLLQKLKLAFVNGLDGVAAVAVKCHLPPPVTVVSLRAPATFSRCLRPPVSPRLGKEVNRQRLQIRCHRRSCLILHDPSKEPVRPVAQSSSGAGRSLLPTSSNRTFISLLLYLPLPLPLTLPLSSPRLVAPRSHCLLAPSGGRPLLQIKKHWLTSDRLAVEDPGLE